MSSQRSAPVVDVTLRSSLLSTVFVTCVTALALAAVYRSGMDILAKAGVFFVLLAGSIYWILDRGLRVLPGSVVRAVMLHDEECILIDRRGRSRSMILTGGVALGSLVAVLSLQGWRLRRRTLCAFAGSVDRDTLRRVRARLRLPVSLPVRHSLSHGHRRISGFRGNDPG